MRKVMPCSGCGKAKLRGGVDYVMRTMPSIFSSRGCSLRYTCQCGQRMEVTRAQFAAIPNENLTVDGQ